MKCKFFKVEAGCRSTSAYHFALKGKIIITHFTGGYRCPIFKCSISDGCSLSGTTSCAPGRTATFIHNLDLSRMSLLDGKKKCCCNWTYIRRVNDVYICGYRLTFKFKILLFCFLPFKYLPAQDCRLQESLQAPLICLRIG